MGKCEKFHYIITFCLIIVQDAKDKLSYIDKITFIVFFNNLWSYSIKIRRGAAENKETVSDHI